jgi:membrane-associated phospholipid phosphatase
VGYKGVVNYRKTLAENQQAWPVTAHPWRRHVLFLLPVLVAVACFHILLLPNARELKMQYPTVTAGLRWATTYLVIVFYAVYAVLLVDAVRKKDYPRQRLVWRYVAVQIVVGLLIVSAIKSGLGLPRPNYADKGICPAFFKHPHAPTPDHYRSVLGVLCLPKGSHQAFPSGHTADILISTLPLALFYWNRYRHAVVILCSLSAVLVVFSRLWLGSHHAIDTLGGAALACVGVYFILRRPPARTATILPARPVSVPPSLAVPNG